MESELTWQEAKTKAQEMEREIAALIPEDKVVKVDQDETGLLFSCSGTQHNWTGSTIVALSKGTEGESFVKAIEAHYQDSRYDIKTRLDIAGEYEVQLRSPDSAESYLISGGWDPNAIRISSGSACFTLPEGVSSRGEF